MVEWVEIGEGDWEGDFEEIAFIGISHEQFATRFGISFTKNTHYEAPGPMAYAAIELRSGAQFLLHHDYDYPQPGVWLSGRIDVNAGKQRAQFAEVLGLNRAAITAGSSTEIAGWTQSRASRSDRRARSRW